MLVEPRVGCLSTCSLAVVPIEAVTRAELWWYKAAFSMVQPIIIKLLQSASAKAKKLSPFRLLVGRLEDLPRQPTLTKAEDVLQAR